MRPRQRNTRVRSEPNQQTRAMPARTKRPRNAQNGELSASRLQLGNNPADQHGGALYDLDRPDRPSSTVAARSAETVDPRLRAELDFLGSR